MMRLIDADTLIKQMTYAMPFDSFNKVEWEKFASLGTLTGLVDSQPTIDAVPIVHGEWERIKKQPYFRKHFANEVVCSNCHRRGDERYNFCPNCGAKMNGKENG